MKPLQHALILSLYILIILPFISACGGPGSSGNSDTNTPPVAYGRSLIVQCNSTAEFELGGKDADGDILTYRVLEDPQHGIVQQLAVTTWKYSPYIDYEGTDSFTFVANDGLEDSKPALVNIFIGAANHAPRAYNQVVSTDMDISVAITLEATDEDEGDYENLSYSIADGADVLHGTLIRSLSEANVWTYTPDTGYQGTDSFMYRVSDGFFESNTATVIITVSYINEKPTAGDVSLTTDEGTPVSGTFTMYDNNSGDTLTASIVDYPANGSLTLDGTDFVYTPYPYFNGTDSFTYQAFDGIDYSNETATVSVTVNAVNDAPTARDMTTAVLQGESITFDLPGHDPDGDPLTYEILSSVAHGTLIQANINSPEVTYQSTATLGAVSFQYLVRDSYNNVSETKTITIIVKQAGVVFVRADATGNNDGSSWYHAYNHPQDAVDGALDGDSIWIARGTYYPENGTEESVLTVNKNLTLYGGFTGTENSLSQRPESSIVDDSAAYRTVLNGQNSVKHVIVSTTDIVMDKIAVQEGSSPVSGSTLLDSGGGVYHTSGTALINNCLFDSNNAVTGGGVYASEHTAISITDTTFQNNKAGENGGGIYIGDSTNSILDNITCIENHATINGGGVFIAENSSLTAATTLTDSTFTDNRSFKTGGALCNLGNGTIHTVTFTGNTARHGGAVYDGDQDSHYSECILTGNGGGATDAIATINGGAFYTQGTVSITDLTFTGNRAQYGGALYTDESGIDDKSEIMITTSHFNNNTATVHGGAVFNFNSGAVFDRCEIGTTTGNSAGQNGGAVANCGYGEPVFWLCHMTNNSAVNGGAVYNYEGTAPLFFGCIVSDNEADNAGGASYDHTEDTSTELITQPDYINCLIVTNRQLNNGCVTSSHSNAIIYNCTIANNISTSDNCDGIYLENRCTLYIENTIIWKKLNFQYEISYLIYNTNDDSSVDKLFCYILTNYDLLYSEETLFSQYYLLKATLQNQNTIYANPCINGGNPDISGKIPDALYSAIINYAYTQDSQSNDEDRIDQGYHTPTSYLLNNPVTLFLDL